MPILLRLLFAVLATLSIPLILGQPAKAVASSIETNAAGSPCASGLGF